MFRPAESDQLLAGEQVIGIPAMRMRTSGDGSSVCSDADAHDHDRVTSSTELQPNTPNGAVDRPAARAAPLYYFAIVQKQEAAGNVATALAERPPADPRSLSCSEIPPFSPLMEDMSSMAFRSFDGVSMGAATATGGRQPLSWPGPEGWDRSATNLQTPGPSAGVRRGREVGAGLDWCLLRFVLHMLCSSACEHTACFPPAAHHQPTTLQCASVRFSLGKWASRCRPSIACGQM